MGTPGALDPKWQALLAGNTDPYQPNAQLPPTATPTVGAQNGPGVTLPQLSDGGFGRDTGPQNPLMGLLGGIGNLFGASSAQAAPAPGVAQQPNLPAPAAAGPGIGDRLGSAWQGLGQGGLTSMVGGLITGQRQDPQGLLERALVARGVDPQMAHAGVKNPQLLPTLLQELPQQATTNALRAALVKSGRYSLEEANGIATAVALNPALAPAILPQAFGAKYEAKTVKDLVGEHIEAFDPITGTVKSTTGGGGAGTGDGVGGPTVLAPNVKKYDPYLGADEYMAQFSPDMQSAIKMQLKGDAMPTGNPRLQGLWPTAKGFAALYADKAGIPFSDAIYNAKRVMRTQLAQSGNSSIGGILSNGDSAFKHLGELGESFADLGNYSGPNIPGGAYIGEAGNIAGNVIAPTPKIRGKLAAIADNTLHYGQESTKFYSGTGGGEAERMHALKEVGGGGTNAEVQAAYLEKEKSLMLDRLNTKLQDIRQTLGDDEAQKIIADKMPSLNKSVAKIDAAIARLRGEAAPQQGAAGQQQGAAPGQQQAPAAPTTLPPPGKDGWIVLPNGHRIREMPGQK
jgi:hypothetical protein